MFHQHLKLDLVNTSFLDLLKGTHFAAFGVNEQREQRTQAIEYRGKIAKGWDDHAPTKYIYH